MRYVLPFLFVFGWLVAPPLSAQPTPADEIARLEARIALLEERLARIESGARTGIGADNGTADAASGAEAVAGVQAGLAAAAEAPAKEPVQRVVSIPAPPAGNSSRDPGLALRGDLRYRHETVNDDAFPVRHRHRIRARINATGSLAENLVAGFGLSTGGSANDSGNQSLDGGFARKSLGLDLAWFDWSISDRLTLLGGKMSNPFFRPGSYHLLHDSDIRPEGLALRLAAGAWFANAAAFWAEERSSGPDTMWYGLQAGYRGSPARGVSLVAGASLHELGHARGRAPVFTPLDGQGNQLDADGRYLYGFSQVEAFGEVRFDVSGQPLRLFVDYITNTAADAYADGLALGIDYAWEAAAGSWNAAWVYQDLEANAVVGAFADSDFAGGASDGRGHTLRARYTLPGGWGLALRYIIGERGEAAGRLRDYNRLQADVNFSY